MNTNLISRYLQFLRKSNSYTQEELAGKLEVSRQAVSKWETNATLPDLETLLKLSKLYGLSVNDLLEPRIPPQRIVDFEELSAVPGQALRDVLSLLDAKTLVTASLGASPDIRLLLEELLPDIPFDTLRASMGPVRIQQVEDAQEQILSMINLYFIEQDSPNVRKPGANDASFW